MSRIARALAELGRSDAEANAVRLDLFSYRGIHELREPLNQIAGALTRLERRKRRSRIVLCDHPELHPDIEQAS